jgi:hypothetical protein
MRQLVISKIVSNWLRGINDTLNVCFLMGWTESWEQNHDGYFLSVIVPASQTEGSAQQWKLEYKKDSEDLQRCLAACSDQALITWLEAQHSQIYR